MDLLTYLLTEVIYRMTTECSGASRYPWKNSSTRSRYVKI